MARKKINLAQRMFEGAELLRDHDPSESVARALCALRHWSDAHGISYLGASIEADKRYQNDLNGESSGTVGLAHSRRYTGWDRIHDDNKAEGRPVGEQWSDDGVRYVGGVKVCGR